MLNAKKKCTMNVVQNCLIQDDSDTPEKTAYPRKMRSQK